MQDILQVLFAVLHIYHHRDTLYSILYFKKVIASDISQSKLVLLKKKMDSRFIENVKKHQKKSDI